jgi:hypothetical protein
VLGRFEDVRLVMQHKIVLCVNQVLASLYSESDTDADVRGGVRLDDAPTELIAILIAGAIKIVLRRSTSYTADGSDACALKTESRAGSGGRFCRIRMPKACSVGAKSL